MTMFNQEEISIFFLKYMYMYIHFYNLAILMQSMIIDSILHYDHCMHDTQKAVILKIFLCNSEFDYNDSILHRQSCNYITQLQNFFSIKGILLYLYIMYNDPNRTMYPNRCGLMGHQ